MTEEALPSNVALLKSNTTYRLADLIYRKGIRWEQDRKTVLSSPEFSDTVLNEYLRKMRAEEDWEVLKNVINRHAQRFDCPANDELVIHVRLGDTMADSDEFKSRSYERSLAVYSKLDIDLPDQITRATIVTAMHFGANDQNNKYFYSELAHQRSLEVIEVLTERLKALGLPMKLVSTSNIDSDFCYLAKAKFFIRSFSRMSDLVTLCLDENACIWAPPKGNNSYRFDRVR